MEKMKTFKTIDAYIKSYPDDIQALLQSLRRTIQKSAGKATEAMVYGIPTFKLNGNLVHFGGFKRHIGFFPGRAGIEANLKEAAPYLTGKGTLRFPIDKPMPLALIRKIVRFRVKENLSKQPKKRS
jgi:uncharacterized protein YdhG (YjbR/CyaY superfamily)